MPRPPRSRRTRPAAPPSVPLNVRLPAATAKELHDYVRETATTASAAAVQCISESLRMNRFPGIDFRWTPTGRRPHITGTGLTVWEMRMIWEDHGSRLSWVRRNYPHLRPDQILAGVAYFKAYPDEKMPPARVPASFQIVRV